MELPLIVEPEQLAESLGAVRLEYASVIASRDPVGGLLPEASQLGSALSALGLTSDHHVVAYDVASAPPFSRRVRAPPVPR